jgi:hypothetical protein
MKKQTDQIKKEGFFKRFLKRLKEDKKTQIITLIVVALVALAVVLGYFFMSGKDWKILDIKKGEKEEEGLVPRRLDGVLVEAGKDNPHLVAVIIENLTTVRPQAGLSSAGVVYEALAEGGITRFLAIFGGGEVDLIGPVRSMRAYYLEWCSEYDALCAHIGGSPEALQAISGLGIKDMNAMYGDSKYFWRDQSVAAPHNLFTKSEFLNYALRDKKLEDVKPTYEAWKFIDDEKKENRPQEEKRVTIDFSSAGYAVEYRYDRETNSYLRFNAGAEHTDRNTGKQISPKNVMIVVVPRVEIMDEKGRLQMDVTGEGKAYMFSNGESFVGTWKKPARIERTKFYHEDGTEHEFVRGQTWVEVVPEDRKVEHN